MLDRSSLRNLLSRYGFFILSLVYLLIAFKLLPDYGLGFDSPKNFDEGRVNLNYLLTGNTSVHDQISLTYQIHGAFFFMVADLFKRVLSDGLGWLDPVSARHAFLPILIVFFMNFYYTFLKKRTGAWIAGLACVLLLTTPVFFGHTFNNIKDIPLVVCFSLSIFCFYEWRASDFQKLRYFYGFFLAFGLSFLSKFYAILIPVLLILWLALLKELPIRGLGQEPSRAGGLWTRKNLFHGLLGLALVLLLVVLFFMPAFYPIKEKALFWQLKVLSAKRLMQHGTQGWSFYPWIQVFFIMPVLTLAMAALGMIKTFLEKPLSALSALMLAWFFTVMFAACTPLFPVYHGIRLFMVFLVPFCFFSATGVAFGADLLGKASPLKKTLGILLLGGSLIAFQVIGIVQTHPYETTFYNRLAGGLKGAQEKNVPDAADYWLSSYREAVQWVNEKAPPNAYLLVPGPDSYLLLKYYPIRKDILFDMIRSPILPAKSFLLIASGQASWVNVPPDKQESILKEMGRMMKAHEIRRQNGNILTIYYKPF